MTKCEIQQSTFSPDSDISIRYFHFPSQHVISLFLLDILDWKQLEGVASL